MLAAGKAVAARRKNVGGDGGGVMGEWGTTIRGYLARLGREKRASPIDIKGTGPEKGVYPGEV